jgi:hypothetical protein
MASKLIAGVYKGRAMPETAKLGTTEKGHEQIGFMVQISRGGGHRDIVPMYLVFSDGPKGSAKYSMERLRALGWEGTDLRDLRTIGRNLVDVRVDYEIFEGEEKLRVEIVTGLRMDRPMNESAADSFAKRFAALAEATPIVVQAAPEKKPNGAPAGYVPPEDRGDAYEGPP